MLKIVVDTPEYSVLILFRNVYFDYREENNYLSGTCK